MNKEYLIEFLKESLSVNVKVESDYCYDEGWKDSYRVQLVLDGEVISETLSWKEGK